MTWLGGRENDAIYSMYTERKNSSLPHFQVLCQMVKLFFQGPKSSEKTLKILKNTERIQPNTFTFNLHTFPYESRPRPFCIYSTH